MANKLMNPASWFPRAELSQMKAEQENDDRVVAACDVSFHQPTSTHDSQRWHLLHERHTIRAQVRSQSVPPSTHAGSLADNGPGSRLLLLISRGAACMLPLCMAYCVT
ncbi:hypothetical protein H0G86_004864 [Trichoderma simmonsii]|uniref:Uncharacterized protein n=1 Tax=Trichoderma simmonsii TaxID=1491479 RepID=A0A8G0L8D9_9HYPO|nr:hypothetical protein H0G86_004864 [Trichoderma simmonsii]